MTGQPTVVQRAAREMIRQEVSRIRGNLVHVERNVKGDKDLPVEKLQDIKERLAAIGVAALELRLWTDPPGWEVEKGEEEEMEVEVEVEVELDGGK